MRTRKYDGVFKGARESFFRVAAIHFIFEVISGFVKNGIPGIVKWVVFGFVGLIARCFSGKNASRSARGNQYVIKRIATNDCFFKSVENKYMPSEDDDDEEPEISLANLKM